MALVSVVIPVYKVEKYIKQCIDSVVCQSLRDIEIILIDDGSPDNCGRICDEYAAKDDRIRVIHQKNAGLSAARNAGIKAATSDYIMFVDSDDWVEPDFCKVPYELAKEHGADLVMFYYVRKPKRSENLPPCGIITRDEAVLITEMVSGIEVLAWNKLYHKSIFEKVQYPLGRYYEDCAVITDVIHNANRIYLSDSQLYNYRVRKGSITRVRDEKVSRDHYEMLMHRADRLRCFGYAELSERVEYKAKWAYIMSLGSKGELSKEYLEYFTNLDFYPSCFKTRSKTVLRILKLMPFALDAICTVRIIVKNICR